MTFTSLSSSDSDDDNRLTTTRFDLDDMLGLAFKNSINE